jgi:hypothetical protein
MRSATPKRKIRGLHRRDEHQMTGRNKIFQARVKVGACLGYKKIRRANGLS